MKKIFQFIKGIIKGILGNLDYVAAFVLGAAAYKFAPEQLESIYNAIITFDYGTAFESIKDGAISLYEGGKSLVEQAIAYFKGDEMPMEMPMEMPAEMPADMPVESNN